VTDGAQPLPVIPAASADPPSKRLTNQFGCWSIKPVRTHCGRVRSKPTIRPVRILISASVEAINEH